jgi:hypothetical protein
MDTYVSANQKGEVGKTTVTLGVAAEIAARVARCSWSTWIRRLGPPLPLVEVIEEGWIARPAWLHRSRGAGWGKRPGPVQGTSSHRPGVPATPIVLLATPSGLTDREDPPDARPTHAVIAGGRVALDRQRCVSGGHAVGIWR